MELGTQIKVLRLQRRATQETLADALGVTSQAVSKWERGESAPDISLLPALSAYFGVSIDELFALSDETRIQRIQNMVDTERVLDPAVVEREMAFLLEKAQQEPDNGRPHELLAQLENHLAREHRDRAADYAKESLRREPERTAPHNDLVAAMGGKMADWCASNHTALIRWYQEFVAAHPNSRTGYLWLLDSLIDDGRLEEARKYLAQMEPVDGTFRTPLYRGLIAWAAGERKQAMEIWRDMEHAWPQEWLVAFTMGDVLIKNGRYEEAQASYRRAYDLQPAPKYLDSLESISLVRELSGDPSGAAAALEEAVQLLAQQWDITSGEEVDRLRREIARLSR